MSNTHEANIIRVGPILPHPNADKLELTMVSGYQVVIGKGSFVEGDLAIYIQPDSVVPQTEPFKFIWQKHVGIDGVVPTKRRRVTVKRLRKEYSEGLLMPVTDFNSGAHFDGEWLSKITEDGRPYVCFRNTVGGITSIPVGSDVSSLLGIEHYVPEFDLEETGSVIVNLPHRKYPKTLRGWFYFLLRKLGLRNAGGRSYVQEVSFNFPVYDVNALKNAKRERFAECGETVFVTEKIHGSNARYVFIPDSKKENPLNPNGKFYVGSHEQWKMDGPNVWWNAARQHPEIEEWCITHPGLVLYGEVGPTQKGFRYGCKEGETFFYAFDVFDPERNQWYWPGDLGFVLNVPGVYVGAYNSEMVKALAEGRSLVPGAENIREGVVVSSHERRLKLKVVSNAYLEKESR